MSQLLEYMLKYESLFVAIKMVVFYMELYTQYK